MMTSTVATSTSVRETLAAHPSVRAPASSRERFSFIRAALPPFADQHCFYFALATPLLSIIPLGYFVQEIHNFSDCCIIFRWRMPYLPRIGRALLVFNFSRGEIRTLQSDFSGIAHAKEDKPTSGNRKANWKNNAFWKLSVTVLDYSYICRYRWGRPFGLRGSAVLLCTLCLAVNELVVRVHRKMRHG